MCIQRDRTRICSKDSGQESGVVDHRVYLYRDANSTLTTGSQAHQYVMIMQSIHVMTMLAGVPALCATYYIHGIACI